MCSILIIYKETNTESPLEEKLASAPNVSLLVSRRSVPCIVLVPSRSHIWGQSPAVGKWASHISSKKLWITAPGGTEQAGHVDGKENLSVVKRYGKDNRFLDHWVYYQEGQWEVSKRRITQPWWKIRTFFFLRKWRCGKQSELADVDILETEFLGHPVLCSSFKDTYVVTKVEHQSCKVSRPGTWALQRLFRLTKGGLCVSTFLGKIKHLLREGKYDLCIYFYIVGCF